jgi:hypothetical protein
VGAVRRRGVVLQSAKGPQPSLVELVAGEPIRGSWWGHPASHEIFAEVNVARDSSAIIATRLVGGKVTLIHRRLWPALVRLAAELPAGALDALHEEHTPSGAHRTSTVPFPDWVPPAVVEAGRALDGDEARAALPAWVRAALWPGG